ncbi:uncharacterized protein LOC141817818 [Curcuma longa]|uniref:uncharacterized protein LOC141817818 n=1 Tax=Curcuma longa TaxID=136217 RepID=UPI003D9DBAC9
MAFLRYLFLSLAISSLLLQSAAQLADTEEEVTIDTTGTAPVPASEVSTDTASVTAPVPATEVSTDTASVPAPSSVVAAAPGTIQRTTKEQILASIPPNPTENTVPFITSPSGKYTASLLRRETAPGAGGFGNDFCYIQVVDTSTGHSMWESQCGPVSSENACSVVFTAYGLQVFDGSKTVWDTGAESAGGNYLATLELVDQGDMRIRDKDGELAWKASQDARANQNCGLPGSPGLAPALPPFAQPIGGNDKNHPFGQPAGAGSVVPRPNTAYGSGLPEQHTVDGETPAFGFNSQPLVDNSPYDSGCTGGTIGLLVRIGVSLFIAAALA